MSVATYLQRGETWDYKNETTSEIAPGTIVAIGGRIGIVGGGGAGPLQPGQLGTVERVGIWRIPKAASEAIAQGAVVYLDSSEKATTTAGAVVAGECAWAAVAADEFVLVDIGAPVAVSGS